MSLQGAALEAARLAQRYNQRFAIFCSAVGAYEYDEVEVAAEVRDLYGDRIVAVVHPSGSVHFVEAA